MIAGVQGGFWSPGDALLLHLAGFALLLIVKLYIYVLRTYLHLSG